MFIKNRYFAYLLMFLEGTMSPCINKVAFVYMLEFVSSVWQNYVSVIYCVGYATVPIVCAFYFQVISNQYLGLMAIGLIMMVCSCIAVFFLPESPLFLLNTGKVQSSQ